MLHFAFYSYIVFYLDLKVLHQNLYPLSIFTILALILTREFAIRFGR